MTTPILVLVRVYAKRLENIRQEDFFGEAMVEVERDFIE